MLYQYIYVANHKLNALNKHLNYFFYKIRGVKNNASFRIVKYFHSDFLPIINNSPELKKKFNIFFNTYKKLEDDKKDKFDLIIIDNIRIEGSYENMNYCCLNIRSDYLTALLGNNSLNYLMNHLYDTLKSSRYKIEEHYKIIYNSMPQKVCPFCGLSKMSKIYREDYDHLAPKSKYPLLAINIKNLAPMCHQCNTKFKKEIDIYYKDGKRRPFTYPYTSSLNIDIDFTGSIIDQTDLNNIIGTWTIKIIPSTTVNETWKEVFQIEKRYKEDYLESSFNDWVDEFIDSLILYNVPLNNRADVINQLKLMADSLYNKKLNNCNIIKAPLFRFLAGGDLLKFYDSIILKYNKKLAA